MGDVFLLGWDPDADEYRKVIIDANGKLKISDVDPFTIAQATPEDLKHVPHGYYADGLSYLPLAVDADGVLKTAPLQAQKLDDLADVAVPSPTDGYVLYWDAATSLWEAKAIFSSKIVDADGDTKVDVEESADEDKIHMDVKGVEAFLLDDVGILTLAKQSYTYVYKADDQEIETDTWTLMLLDTVVTDIQGEFNATTHTFTAKTAGIYMIEGRVTCKGNSVDGQDLDMQINRNGSKLFDAPVVAAAANKYLTSHGVLIMALAVNDYLELIGAQSSGESQTLSGGMSDIHLMVAKIA